MMDHPGDDDAGETSAVKSKIQLMKPSDQEIATHEARGHYPYRVWCRALVALGGQTLTNDSGMNKTVYSWRAWTLGSPLVDRNQGREMTVQAEHDDLEHACAMQRRGGPDSDYGRVVEQTWLPRADQTMN